MPDSRIQPQPDIELAATLLTELAAATPAKQGVTRPSYSEGEQIAHDMVRGVADKLDLTTKIDGTGNLYCTLAGQVRGRPIIIGSHLDSVPEGGNYDGPVGVFMGLAVVSGFRKAGIVPPVDITVMSIRAEESVWFDASFLGSRGAFGQLDPSELDTLLRTDSKLTLAAHMTKLGLDVEAVRTGRAYLQPDMITAFIEPHIEQGPVLIGANVPVGIVTSVRGGRRFRHARCVGQDAHSGAAPMNARSDAVLATSILVAEIDRLVRDHAVGGCDIVFTTGIFSTDPARHAFSKVAGLVNFSVDIRSDDIDLLDRIEKEVISVAERIGKEQRVNFELGPPTGSVPVSADPDLVDGLVRAADAVGIPAIVLPSGAGHDAAVFARNGVPTSMLFIRNACGSHNPDEAMEIDDFSAAANVLNQFCLDPFAYGVQQPRRSSSIDCGAVA